MILPDVPDHLRVYWEQLKLWNQLVPVLFTAAVMLTTREYDSSLAFITQTGLKKAQLSWVKAKLLHRVLVGPNIAAAAERRWSWFAAVGPKQAV